MSIAKEVGHMNFKGFQALSILLHCRAWEFKDHVGDNVYTKMEFHLNGWRFVCDNVRLFIAMPDNTRG